MIPILEEHFKSFSLNLHELFNILPLRHTYPFYPMSTKLCQSILVRKINTCTKTRAQADSHPPPYVKDKIAKITIRSELHGIYASTTPTRRTLFLSLRRTAWTAAGYTWTLRSSSSNLTATTIHTGYAPSASRCLRRRSRSHSPLHVPLYVCMVNER